MNGYDHDHDPMQDDDFDVDDEHDEEADDSTEARVWQLLLLINPGDEETALQQFAAYREMAEAEDDSVEPGLQVARVIDWRSGFLVEPDDCRSLVQALDELAARWNLTIDWGGDSDDEEFLDTVDVPGLLGTAHDRLAEHGYSVWVWEAADGSYAGWITRKQDSEPMRELATALEIDLHSGSQIT